MGVQSIAHRRAAPFGDRDGRENSDDGDDDHELDQSEAVVLERYGRRAAVLISPERYDELMEAYEELEDIEAFDASMSEEGDSIPWEQVKADLGWA